MSTDIRFHGHLAYLTDAGVPGVIVLDLVTGKARRVLDHDKSTTGTRSIVVDSEVVRGPESKPILLNTDQMEVSPDGGSTFSRLPGGCTVSPRSGLMIVRLTPQASHSM
jgi:hypothetical protein